MNKRTTRRATQKTMRLATAGLDASLKKQYLITIAVLIILSVLNISLKSDQVSRDVWSVAVEVRVTSITLILVFLFWMPVLLPWFLTQAPRLQGSLNWLRAQGIEEIESSVLKIKLKYGVQEASRNYEEQISEPGANSDRLNADDDRQQIEKRYQEAIALIDAMSTIDATEALDRINQLAVYYDRVRDEMPPGANRTRLMLEISSTMWALVNKTVDFPVLERLNSPKAGERLSAYKYIEWQPSSQYLDLLLSRAIGILEIPFGQYAALLALRRLVTLNPLTPTQASETINLLTWSAKLDYFQADKSRPKLMMEIAAILQANL
ncbi:MAG TPA: hypothetical protein V6C88_14220 [Chroococcidiopsis sp.]